MEPPIYTVESLNKAILKATPLTNDFSAQKRCKFRSQDRRSRANETKRVVSELRTPASLVLHIHRCIGREQQLHHRCFAFGCCVVQRGVTSAQRQHTAREGFEQSHSQSHCEPVFLSRNFIKPHLHYMNPCENGESILSALHNHPFLHVLPSNGKPNLFKTRVA